MASRHLHTLAAVFEDPVRANAKQPIHEEPDRAAIVESEGSHLREQVEQPCLLDVRQLPVERGAASFDALDSGRLSSHVTTQAYKLCFKNLLQNMNQ